MFNNRKPVPFFAKGPDANRYYAQDIKRWSIIQCNSKDDDCLVKVRLNSGWGHRETLGTVLIPFVGFVLFGSMCLAIRYFDPQNDFTGQFFLAIVGICLMQVVFFGTFIWLEDSYFARLPSETLTIYRNREFSVDGDKSRRKLPTGSILRYTLHHSSGGGQHGESSKSELDLVVRDESEIISVHPIMAFQDNWCWKPAQKLSQWADLPLQRVSLQANGKRFPPALLD